MSSTERPRGLSRPATLLFAVGAGAAVANLYWAQPLLDDLSRELAIPAGAAGLLVTVAQLGYAAGGLLIAPLGDSVDRRRLLPALLVACAVALAGCAAAPSFPVLLVTLGLVGLTTVTGQMLVALSGDLAEPSRRGRTVATVVSGLLLGILLSRTVSGFVADLFTWRTVFAGAAVVALVFAVLLRRAVPPLPPRTRVGYPALLGSVFSAFRRFPLVTPTVAMSSAVFAVFSMFWTAQTFLLSAPPFSYPLTTIGLMGLVGAAGALAAQRGGLVHDRGWTTPAVGIGLLLALVSVVVSGLGARSIVALVVAVLLLDVAVQTVNVLNQTRLLGADPTAGSRLNTLFVTGNFVGGAIGSALAGLLWHLGGWTAVMLGAATLLGFALTVWFASRSRMRAAG